MGDGICLSVFILTDWNSDLIERAPPVEYLLLIEDVRLLNFWADLSEFRDFNLEMESLREAEMLSSSLNSVSAVSMSKLISFLESCKSERSFLALY